MPDSITVEDLLSNNYKSTPRNKLVADFCKSLGLIEKYGSGIRRIVDYFKAENLDIPEFRNISDGFMVTIFRNEIGDVGKDVGKELTGSAAEVYKLIQRNPEFAIQEIAVITKYTTRTVERSISKLKELKLIRRIGGRKEGKWDIIG